MKSIPPLQERLTILSPRLSRHLQTRIHNDQGTLKKQIPPLKNAPSTSERNAKFRNEGMILCVEKFGKWGQANNGSLIFADLGPTNTGKTHRALQRMLELKRGIIGLPLRLLAREVYDKLVAQTDVRDVALFTGEERIFQTDLSFMSVRLNRCRWTSPFQL